MAKKAKAVRTRRVSESTAIAVPPRPQLVLDAQQVKLDIHVDMDRIESLARNEISAPLEAERSKVIRQLDEARAVHKDLEAQLKLCAVALGQTVNQAQAQLAADTMAAFSGKVFKVKSDEGVCDVDKQTVTVTVRVGYKSQYYDNKFEGVLSHEETLPFTTKMRDLLDQLVAQSATIRGIQTRLDTIGQALSEVPRFVAKAGDALTRNYLEGGLQTGDDVLSAIEMVKASVTDRLQLTCEK
jgi:mRNA-degrading endonuclease HigB of HigAB toxin-antitoxin module